MRVVSLCESETGSREVSPAHSVWWAGAGASTSPSIARWSQPPSAKGNCVSSPGQPTPAKLV
ncbi:hypothetical protein BGW80DRAFT_1271437 [Lactifluus volemus]|nr:hypothetical protein BGW80DRAFT_1271437 [Lactifluus volemus]